MKVLITGGTGFIGLGLARRLLARGALTGPSGAQEEIDALVLLDAAAPAGRPAGLDDRAELVSGDVADRDTVFALADRDDMAVFHLASVVSASAERDFDLALRVNLDGSRNVLEALRARAGTPRLVFASTIAAYGGDPVSDAVTDATKQAPTTTYGMTKAVCELLVNDYARKGFLDGRTARLPTVVIRPGAPNAAASSFASAVFREPLAGRDYALPLGLHHRLPVIGVRTVVENLVRLHEVDPAALGDDRAVLLPSVDPTVGEMVDAMRRAAGDRRVGNVTVEPDAAIERIVAGWPARARADRALALGLLADESLDAVVRAYLEDYGS